MNATAINTMSSFDIDDAVRELTKRKAREAAQWALTHTPRNGNPGNNLVRLFRMELRDDR